MSAEQLDALEVEAAAVDGANAPPGAAPAEEQQPQIDEAGQIAGLLTILANMGAPMFPSIGRIYTQQTIGQIAGVLEPVFVKHGWSVSNAFGKYAEEFAALAVILPVALATYQGIREDMAAAAAKAVEPEAKPAQPEA